MPKTVSNAEIFIERYKELEQAVRSEYNISDYDSISFYLGHKTKYKKYQEDIAYCQKIRNFFAHNGKVPDGVNRDFAVEPNDCMIDFITQLIDDIKNRERCIDVAVRLNEVYWCRMSHNVKTAVRIMREKGFTHVPVLEGGRVVGVFDEFSVINCLSDSENAYLEKELRFSQIKQYISFSARGQSGYTFVPSKMYAEELREIIDTAYSEGRRIRMAFVTANGSPDETLLGIITPWDLIK